MSAARRSMSGRAEYISERLHALADERVGIADRHATELRGYAIALAMLSDDLDQLAEATRAVADELEPK